MLLNRNLQQMVPTSLEFLNDQKQSGTQMFDKHGQLHKVYQSYISALGALIVQMGLLPALSIYLAEKKETQAGNKALTMDGIAYVLGKFSPEYENIKSGNELFQYAVHLGKNSKRGLFILEEHIKEASVALKLSMRTFATVEEE